MLDVVVVAMMNEQSGSPEVSLAFPAQPFRYRAKPVPRQNRKIARKTRVTSYQYHLQYPCLGIIVSTSVDRMAGHCKGNRASSSPCGHVIVDLRRCQILRTNKVSPQRVNQSREHVNCNGLSQGSLPGSFTMTDPGRDQLST
jgi:hypothetical protein